MAGECGNRTHPTLLSKVTVILKITEATRPHPPPFPLVDFDSNLSPLHYFARRHRARDPRKIASALVLTDADGQPTGGLRVIEDRVVLFAADIPAHEVT